MDLLINLWLVAVEPLLPLLAGAGLYWLTRSHVKAVVIATVVFAAWSALYFARLSVDGPLSGALYGLTTGGVTSALTALAGSGYMHLVAVETNRLGKQPTMLVHAGGVAFAVVAFVAMYASGGSDKVGLALYLALLCWSLGVSFKTGSFGGVFATTAFALVAMVQGLIGAAFASKVPDAGQAAIAIFYVPPLLLPLLATAGLGWWIRRRMNMPESPEQA